MQHENHKSQTEQKDADFLVLDIDDIEEIEFSDDEIFEANEPKTKKKKNRMVRKTIEEILAERELKKQLADVFDEDILLD
jgi:hypothetical protein